MIYKCLNCSAALRFDVTTGRMVCDYCNSSFTPEEVHNSVLAESTVSGSDETTADDGMMEQNLYSCTACGARLMINNVESATFCAYCGQPTIVFDRVNRVKKPELIVPFTVTREKAHEILQQKLHKGFFIPKEIKNLSVDLVRGIYIPFRLVDIDYEDRQVIKGTVHRGKNTYTKYFYRHSECKFRNLTVDASVKFNDISSQRLEPYNMRMASAFDPGYLSGFYADCGDDDPNALHNKALTRSKEIFDEAVFKTIKASRLRTVSSRPERNLLRDRYALLPAWFLVCHHDQKRYTFMVNGQTGKTVGAVPFDKAKVISLSAVIGIVLMAVLGILMGGICTFMDFSDDSSLKLIGGAIVGIIALFSLAISKIGAFKRSRTLTDEKDIMELAANRQEEDK